MGGGALVLTRPRDEHGWRIPKVGTLSFAIYDLHLRGGLNAREIANILDVCPKSVRVLRHRFMHPALSKKQRYYQTHVCSK